MRVPFTKMHGLGNDFMVLYDAPGSLRLDPPTLRRLADRRRGIGFDQALVIEPTERPDAQAYYRIFNADGEEVEQCGNGARCVARLVADRAGDPRGQVVLDSRAGLVRARLLADGNVSVNMGQPDFSPAALPFEAECEAAVYTLAITRGSVEIGAVSIGNPHAVLIVPDIRAAPVSTLGPAIEKHRRFPNRTNVGFMEIVDENTIRLRVHERGVGETLACGTGACGAVAVGRRLGKLGPDVKVELPGGSLHVSWPEPGRSIWLTGPAERAYEGHFDL